MPMKDRIAPGVDLNRLAQAGAKQLIAQRDAARAREGREGHKYEAYDHIVVVAKQLDAAPTIEWTSVTMPFDLQQVRVQASLGEAILNRQSIDELLRRRFRRGFRDLLIASDVMPEDEAKKRVLRVQISVVDAPRILV